MRGCGCTGLPSTATQASIQPLERCGTRSTIVVAAAVALLWTSRRGDLGPGRGRSPPMQRPRAVTSGRAGAAHSPLSFRSVGLFGLSYGSPWVVRRQTLLRRGSGSEGAADRDTRSSCRPARRHSRHHSPMHRTSRRSFPDRPLTSSRSCRGRLSGRARCRRSRSTPTPQRSPRSIAVSRFSQGAMCEYAPAVGLCSPRGLRTAGLVARAVS